jgi:hypothetical protein
VGEASHLDGGARRHCRTEVLHADVDVTEVLVHVGDVRVALDDVGERRTGGSQGGLDVLADLADLRPHVALADDVAVLVARQLAGHEDHAAALDRDHVRVERVTAARRRGKRLGLDVLAGDRHGVSFQGVASNARPTTRARRTFSSIFAKT